MRAVSAKALNILLLSTLLRFAFPFSRRPLVQRDHHLYEKPRVSLRSTLGYALVGLSARYNVKEVAT